MSKTLKIEAYPVPGIPGRVMYVVRLPEGAPLDMEQRAEAIAYIMCDGKDQRAIVLPHDVELDFGDGDDVDEDSDSGDEDDDGGPDPLMLLSSALNRLDALEDRVQNLEKNKVYFKFGPSASDTNSFESTWFKAFTGDKK